MSPGAGAVKKGGGSTTLLRIIILQKDGGGGGVQTQVTKKAKILLKQGEKKLCFTEEEKICKILRRRTLATM